MSPWPIVTQDGESFYTTGIHANAPALEGRLPIPLFFSHINIRGHIFTTSTKNDLTTLPAKMNKIYIVSKQKDPITCAKLPYHSSVWTP